MEIDVREESGGKPDVIRFADQGILEGCNSSDFYISLEPDDWAVLINSDEVPNLIKALKKYQELYGE